MQAQSLRRHPRVDIICEADGIEHRLTRPNRPWTNSVVERMNRKIRDATVEHAHSDSHDQPRTHLADLLDACTEVHRRKTLRGLTPCETICKIRGQSRIG